MHPADILRDRMARDVVLAGGCYDCLSAALLEEVGFGCIAISGAGVAASLLGVPDLGLVTLTEMTDVARRVTARAGVPVVADIDTGFGGLVNVARTIEEFVAAGVAAVHLEDQRFAKRCGHLDGKEIVSTEEFIEKIRTADRARGGDPMLLIARTDALAVHGVDAAIDRAKRALDAGADMAFVEAPSSLSEVEAIAEAVPGPKVYNLVTGGRSPALRVAELGQLGYQLVITPVVALYPTVSAIRTVARAVLERGDDVPLQELDLTPKAFFEAVGLGHWLQISMPPA